MQLRDMVGALNWPSKSQPIRILLWEWVASFSLHENKWKQETQPNTHIYIIDLSFSIPPLCSYCRRRVHNDHITLLISLVMKPLLLVNALYSLTVPIYWNLILKSTPSIGTQLDANKCLNVVTVCLHTDLTHSCNNCIIWKFEYPFWLWL